MSPGEGRGSLQMGIPTSEPHLQPWAISSSACHAVIPGAQEALQDQRSSQTGVVLPRVPARSPSAPSLLVVAVGSWCHKVMVFLCDVGVFHLCLIKLQQAAPFRKSISVALWPS